VPEATETTTPTPEGNATTTPATPAEDAAALKAQLDAVLKHKTALEADLKKHRDAKKEHEDAIAKERAANEAKLKEVGDFAKLYDSEKEKRAALEAQLAELTPKAERLTAPEKRIGEKLLAAKAKGDLPSYIVKAIDAAAARDVDEANDILDEFRAAQPTAPAKVTASPAPNTGGAPAASSTKKLEDMSPAEIRTAHAEGKLDELLGKPTNGTKPANAVLSRFWAS
jgi:chaperonin cofactor prefoldin